MTHGIVLFSHGSRDPQWSEPIVAVATQIAATSPSRPVMCAYLELCQPSLPEAVEALQEQGARHVTVVPMFLGAGKHVREDLARLVDTVRTRYPGLAIHVQDAIGRHPRMTALMADLACSGTEGRTEAPQP